MLAAMSGHSEVTRQLLADARVDVNTTDKVRRVVGSHAGRRVHVRPGVLACYCVL